MERLMNNKPDPNILIIICLIILALLSGCSTTKPYVEVPPIKPDYKIMKDCGEYILPENTIKDFARVISLNQNTFNECKVQNQGKKVFIEQTTK